MHFRHAGFVSSHLTRRFLCSLVSCKIDSRVAKSNPTGFRPLAYLHVRQPVLTLGAHNFLRLSKGCHSTTSSAPVAWEDEELGPGRSGGSFVYVAIIALSGYSWVEWEWRGTGASFAPCRVRLSADSDDRHAISQRLTR